MMMNQATPNPSEPVHSGKRGSHDCDIHHITNLSTLQRGLLANHLSSFNTKVGYRILIKQGVQTVLREKQVPFEVVLVDTFKGEQKLPEYLSKHPFGQVPCIDDDGFILYESRAICYYIASKYADQGPSLLPTGVKANALYQQAVFTEISHFNEHAFPAARELVVKEYQGLTPDKEIVEKHIADLSVKLDVYDQILSKQKYIAGDEITLADFYHLIIGGILSTRTNVMESKPNVARWFKEISTRESWVTVQLEARNNLKSTT